MQIFEIFLLPDIFIPFSALCMSSVLEQEAIEFRDVFCPVCGTFFDLRQVGTEYHCRKCQTRKDCLKSSYSGGPENRMMFTRSVAAFPAATAWLERALLAKKQMETEGEEEDRVGAQRALVAEECPKCKNPKMYFWTQQLRSADEGQTVFYECPKCEHRYSINS